MNVLSYRFSYIEIGDPVALEELGRKRLSDDVSADYSGYIESCVQGLLKVRSEREQCRLCVRLSHHRVACNVRV